MQEVVLLDRFSEIEVFKVDFFSLFGLVDLKIALTSLIFCWLCAEMMVFNAVINFHKLFHVFFTLAILRA